MGATLTGTKAAQLKLIGKMLAQTPSTHGVLTGKPGFRSDGFVLGQRMIGDGVKNYKWDAEPGPKAALGLSRGTLDGWKQNVAAPLVHSTYASFGICFGLAACLPSYIEIKRRHNPELPKLVSETASINYSGDSGSGKTSIGEAVAGLYGEPVLHDWDFSKPSFEESAAARNNLVLVIDDTETYLEESPSLKVQLRTVNEKIPAGRSKARSQVVAGQSYANLTWCTFGMSSSPKSIGELAEEFKWKRTKGELVRYIDISVPKPEEGGIFDEVPGPAHTHSVASSKLVGKLKANVASYYGTAMPAFITMLLQEDMSAEVVKLTEKFVGKVHAKKGWDERLARKFGIAYAAGKLAVKADILPWPEDWVFKAVVRCYRRALAGMAKHADVLNSKLHALKIASTDSAQFPAAKSGAKPIVCTSQTLGVSAIYKGQPVIAVREEGLKVIAGSSAAAKELAKLLGTQRILVGGQGHVRTTQLPVAIKVAGIKVLKPRFYVLDAVKLAAYGADSKAA